MKPEPLVAFQAQVRDLEPVARALRGYVEFISSLAASWERQGLGESREYLAALRAANAAERVRQAIRRAIDGN